MEIKDITLMLSKELDTGAFYKVLLDRIEHGEVHAAVAMVTELSDEEQISILFRLARALARALADGDPAMQRRAMIALNEVTGKDYGGNAKKWQEYLDGGNPEPDKSIWIADRARDVWGAF